MACTILECLKYMTLHSHLCSLKRYIRLGHLSPTCDLRSSTAVKVPKLTDYFASMTTYDLPSLPSLDKQAIAAYCFSHVLPFDIVGDLIFNLTNGKKFNEFYK